MKSADIKNSKTKRTEEGSSFGQLARLVSLQPYYADDNAILFCGASEKVLPLIPANSIDLTVTSPPYDNLRTYKGFTFDFETIAKELYRVTKDGGVVVWVVNDATVDGSETLTSCKQKIFFREQCGFNIHDTMIYEKTNFSHPEQIRYHDVFEYKFILSKGQPKTFNPIKDKINTWKGKGALGVNTKRGKDGLPKLLYKDGRSKMNTEFGMRGNIWRGLTAGQENMCKELDHPAKMPEWIANDHIVSWSNKGDIVLDCFSGSGTTMKAAKLLKRNSIGIEIAKEYCELTVRRINKPMPLFNGLSS